MPHKTKLNSIFGDTTVTILNYYNIPQENDLDARLDYLEAVVKSSAVFQDFVREIQTAAQYVYFHEPLCRSAFNTPEEQLLGLQRIWTNLNDAISLFSHLSQEIGHLSLGPQALRYFLSDRSHFPSEVLEGSEKISADKLILNVQNLFTIGDIRDWLEIKEVFAQKTNTPKAAPLAVVHQDLLMRHIELLERIALARKEPLFKQNTLDMRLNGRLFYVPDLHEELVDQSVDEEDSLNESSIEDDKIYYLVHKFGDEKIISEYMAYVIAQFFDLTEIVAPALPVHIERELGLAQTFLEGIEYSKILELSENAQADFYQKIDFLHFLKISLASVLLGETDLHPNNLKIQSLTDASVKLKLFDFDGAFAHSLYYTQSTYSCDKLPPYGSVFIDFPQADIPITGEMRAQLIAMVKKWTQNSYPRFLSFLSSPFGEKYQTENFSEEHAEALGARLDRLQQIIFTKNPATFRRIIEELFPTTKIMKEMTNLMAPTEPYRRRTFREAIQSTNEKIGTNEAKQFRARLAAFGAISPYTSPQKASPAKKREISSAGEPPSKSKRRKLFDAPPDPFQ